MFSKKSAIAMASLSLFASFVHAEEGNTSFISPIVVSGARIEQPLSEVLPSVTVITKEEIQKSQKQSVADLLQGESGIEIGRSGGIGTVTSFFLRGQESTNVAVFVDGIRLQGDGLGSISGSSASLPPPQAIERIEILRGNAGSLYGESAIGGVINIYTNANLNSAPKAFASITTGSNKTVDSAGGISGRVDDIRFSLVANQTSSAGFDPLVRSSSNANPGAGQYRGDGINLTVSKIIDSNFELGFRDRYQDATVNFGSNYTSGVLSQRTLVNDATIFAKFKPVNNWVSQLDVTNSTLGYSYNPNAIVNFEGTNMTSVTNSINWSNSYEFDRTNKIIFGANYSSQTYQTDGGNKTRNSYNLYVGDTLKVGRFDVQLNGRFDNLSVNDPSASLMSNSFNALTGLFGLGYYVTDELRLTATTSTGFRAPALGEFFPNAGWGYISNPNLMPETHRTNEFGFEYKNSHNLTRVVYFNTVTNNAISSVLVDPANYIYQYQNIPTVTNQGWEFSERAEYMGYRLVGSLTIQNPVNVSTSTPLARRANQYGSLDISKSIGKYDFGTKVISSSMRYDGSNTLGSYNLWSFYGGYKINEELSVRARLDNAFNQDYQLAYGYNTPGTTAWLTLVYQQK